MQYLCFRMQRSHASYNAQWSADLLYLPVQSKSCIHVLHSSSQAHIPDTKEICTQNCACHSITTQSWSNPKTFLLFVITFDSDISSLAHSWTRIREIVRTKNLENSCHNVWKDKKKKKVLLCSSIGLNKSQPCKEMLEASEMQDEKGYSAPFPEIKRDTTSEVTMDNIPPKK